MTSTVRSSESYSTTTAPRTSVRYRLVQNVHVRNVCESTAHSTYAKSQNLRTTEYTVVVFRQVVEGHAGNKLIATTG